LINIQSLEDTIIIDIVNGSRPFKMTRTLNHTGCENIAQTPQ